MKRVWVGVLPYTAGGWVVILGRGDQLIDVWARYKSRAMAVKEANRLTKEWPYPRKGPGL